MALVLKFIKSIKGFSEIDLLYKVNNYEVITLSQAWNDYDDDLFLFRRVDLINYLKMTLDRKSYLQPKVCVGGCLYDPKWHDFGFSIAMEVLLMWNFYRYTWLWNDSWSSECHTLRIMTAISHSSLRIALPDALIYSEFHDFTIAFPFLCPLFVAEVLPPYIRFMIGLRNMPRNLQSSTLIDWAACLCWIFCLQILQVRAGTKGMPF